LAEVLQPEEKQGKVFLGGLRLAVQKWPLKWPGKSGENDAFVSWLVPNKKLDDSDPEPGFLPFGIKTLDAITDAFNLPKTYPHDLLGDYPIPLHLKRMDCINIRGEIVNTNIGLSLSRVKCLPYVCS
jgi:hypothetical protein